MNRYPKWAYVVIAITILAAFVYTLPNFYGEAPAVVSQAGKYFRNQLRHVDLALADGRTYLMGDQFATADIILTTCLTWAIDYGVGICDSAVPYLERTSSRPAYQLAAAANTPRN